MYHCILYLKNKSEWIDYAKNIKSKNNCITDKIIEEILSFPFEFDSFNSDT